MLFNKKETKAKKNLKDLKEFLKEKAARLKKLKPTRKLDKRGDRDLWEIICEISKLKYEFRHHLIAYCEMRGRTREQIEKPSLENLPFESAIEKIKEEYEAVWPEREEVNA